MSSSLIQSSPYVNSQNSHVSNPGFSDKVGAVSGCGGSTTSDLALKQGGLYTVVKVGGKAKRVSKHNIHKRKYRGGNGYGFDMKQDLATKSGVASSGGSVHLPEYSMYKNDQVKSDTNMNASVFKGLTGGGSYYGFQTEGESLSTFAGSGYPPITRGTNTQCPQVQMKMDGGNAKKGHTVHKKKSLKRKNSKRRVMKSKKPRRKEHRTSKTRRHTRSVKPQRGGYSQYMSNVASTPSYSTGAPVVLRSTESALANPAPFTPKNDCLNTWKHVGDLPPYNNGM
jgi:hypothetical protein